MKRVSIIIGQRIRSYRTQLKLSQENLAELAGLHHKYIGQLERGEKNATIETLIKVADALKIPAEKLVEKLGNISEDNARDIPSECYDFIASKSKAEQEMLFKMLIEMDKYKNK